MTDTTGANRLSRKKLFYGYIIVIAGFAVWFFGFGTNNFGVFFKPLIDEFGWSRADTSLAGSLNMVMAAGITIGAGWLTDKLGPRIVVSTFGPLAGIGFLIMPHITSLWQFYLNYALLGSLAGSVLIVPIMVTISRWFVRRRGLMLGIVQSGAIGGSLFAPLNAWLILTYGWRTAYSVLGIVVFAGMLVAGLFLFRDPRDKGQLPDGVSESVVPATPKSRVTGLNLKQAVGTPHFWIIAFLFFSFGFCRDAFFVHTAPHVQDLGFSLIDAGNIMSTLVAFSIFGRIGMGFVSDIIGNKRSLMISEVITVMALILGFFMRDLGGLYIYAAAFGFGWGAQAVNRFAISAETFGLASAGLLMGVLQGVESLAGAIGTYFAGYTFDVEGSYRYLFLVGIIIALASLIVAPALRRLAGRKPERQPLA